MKIWYAYVDGVVYLLYIYKYMVEIGSLSFSLPINILFYKKKGINVQQLLFFCTNVSSISTPEKEQQSMLKTNPRVLRCIIPEQQKGRRKM